MRTKLNKLAEQALNESDPRKSLDLFNKARKEMEVIQMSEERFKKLQADYVEDFLQELSAHDIVVGGTGGIVREYKTQITALLNHLYPNGIELHIHNRRVLKGKDDPLRKGKMKPPPYEEDENDDDLDES